MSISLTQTLHRLGRLKQRFEDERRTSSPNPFRLLKLRAVILRAEQRLRRMAPAPMGRNRRLQPLMAPAVRAPALSLQARA